MSVFKFLATEPAVSGGAGNTFTKPLPAGRYDYIQVTITGTTDTGQTLAVDDLGRVIIEHNEQGQTHRASMAFLHAFTEINGGFPPTVSGSAATAERVVFRIPFGVDPFPNVLQLRNDREASIKFEFDDVMATRFGTNDVNVRIDMHEVTDVAQTYFLTVKSQNQQAQGAGTISDTITGRNIVQIFLEDESPSVVDSIDFSVDGKTIVDNTPLGVLRDNTNIINRVETSGQNWVEILVAGNPVMESTLNRANSFQAEFSGAGTLSLYKLQFAWLPDAQRNANINAVDADLSRKGM